MAKTKFFYWIQFPYGKNPASAWRETDIKCISKTKKKVESAWNAKMPDKEFNSIYEFETDIRTASKTIWVVFDYNSVYSNWSEIKYVGNSYEDCFNWWSENYTEYCNIYTNSAPELSPAKNGDGFVWEARGAATESFFGIRIKQINLS